MPEIPEGMIRLESPPVDDAGAPAWTSEIESKTQRFGRAFLVPVMYEASPGQCLGILVAKAVYETTLRTYEARATLIETKNDEFRTTIVVTAPAVPEWQSTNGAWDACNLTYRESLPQDQAKAIVQRLRQYCIKSHKHELEERAAWDALTSAPLRSAERSLALLNAPTDHALLEQAQKSKGHISLQAVAEEYDRLIMTKIRAAEGLNEQKAGRRPKVCVEFSAWETMSDEYDEMNRTYYFTNLAGPGSTTKIELRCRLDAEQGEIRPFVYLVINPYLQDGTEGVAVYFAPTGELMNYQVLSAKLERPEGAPISFLVFDISDGQHVANVIKSGKEITLIIVRGMPSFDWIKAVVQESGPPPESDSTLAHLALPNDASFASEYGAFKASIEAEPR